MTRHEILFNYAQAMKQADQLDDVARKIGRLATDKMESTTGALKAAWQSDCSPQYIQKMGAVQDEIKGSASSIRKVAQSIRTTAERIRRAELRALEVAQTRSYT